MAHYKVVATDMDGTLLTSDVRITPRTEAAVARVLAAGSRVVLTTGRAPFSARRFYQQLGLTGPAVTYNGALIIDLATDEILFDQPIDPAVLVAAVDDAVAWGALGYYLEGSQGVVAYKDDEITRHRFRRHPLKPFAYGPASEHPEHVCYKVFMYCEPAAAPELWRRLAERYQGQLTLQYYEELSHLRGVSWLEFMAPGVSKAKSLGRLLDQWQLSYEDVLFFGDERNDLELMKQAAYGVATGNAVADLKAVADRVTLTNDEDGVAVVLEELYK